MKIPRSALKHGVSAADAIQAAYWALWVEPLEEDEWPHRDYG